MSNQHPPALPQLCEGNTLHKTVEHAIRRGYANSWAEAYGVGLYLVHPIGKVAGQEWLDHYGVDKSKFFASASLGDEADNAGDVGV